VKLVGLEMQVTVQAIGAVPSLVVYPAIPFIAFGFFFIYWLSALLYLFSAGQIRQNNCTYNSCASYDLYSQTVTDLATVVTLCILLTTLCGPFCTTCLFCFGPKP